jgi:hypothetical protein
MARAAQPMHEDGGPGAAQRASSKFIVFGGIEKINTRAARDALPENEAAWLENLQPIAANNLVTVPAPLPALATLVNESAAELFGANIGAVDYIIAFTAAGAGIAVNAQSGMQITFAPDGTFSNPDMTVYASQRILIMDPVAGYATWDGSVFVQAGGVSPNISVTAGGSGYFSPPSVTISGGTGTGATAHALVASGAVVKIVLDSAGTGYSPGDTLTITFGGPGTGATATTQVWPVLTGSTIAVFAGRVWWAGGRILNWTGTAGYDDINVAHAAGSTTISDADLSHDITALRNLNNYLFVFGDTSVRQIGNITVQSSITLFTPLILASDIGTTFRRTIQSYNRLVLFANKQGVYAIFGASVEKISDDLDGIFQATDFGQSPDAALNDLRNIHCYLVLLRYVDPVRGTRSIIVTFQEKKWYVVSQGAGLKTLCTVPLASSSQIETFASSGSDITQLLQDPNTAVAWELQTSLTAHGNLIQAKQALNAGLFGHTQGVADINFELDTENGSNTYELMFAAALTWLNNLRQPITFVNNAGQPITFCGTGHQFPYTSADGYGKLLGVTVTGTSAQTTVHAAAIEYQEADMWGQSP